MNKIILTMILVMVFTSNIFGATVVMGFCEVEWPDLVGYKIKITSPQGEEKILFFPKDSVLLSTMVECIDSRAVEVEFDIKNKTSSNIYEFELGAEDVKGNLVWFSLVLKGKVLGYLKVSDSLVIKR